MSYIGRRVGVGLGKETTRGTAVSPGFYYPVIDYDFDDKAEIVAREGRLSVIEMTHGGDVVKNWAEGSVSGNVYSQGIGLLLLSAFGGLSTAANADASGLVYDHTFTVDNTTDPNLHQSLTVSIDDSVAGDKEYTNCIVSSLELSGEVGNYLHYTAGFIGNSAASS